MQPFPEAHTFLSTRTYYRSDENYRNNRQCFANEQRSLDLSLVGMNLKVVSFTGSGLGLNKHQTLFHSDPNQFHLLAPEERSSKLFLAAVLETYEVPPPQKLNCSKLGELEDRCDAITSMDNYFSFLVGVFSEKKR